MKLENNLENIKPHLQWWENNLSTYENQQKFSGWLEQSDVTSRESLFKLVDEKKIQNVLEVGPGIFTDYEMFFSKNNHINYSAIDITKKIVEKGKNLGINCEQSSVEEIIHNDNSYDLVYCRHVMEHLDYYRTALEEMLRVSNKYVCVIFWLLSDSEDIIDYNDTLKLYHNKYSKNKIEEFLKEKNLFFEWFNSENDKLLFISKK